MSPSTPAKTALAVVFACVFVATGVVFVSVQATYMGLLDRSAVSATVTDYGMAGGEEGPAVEVTARVTNPTSAAVELETAQVAGYVPGTDGAVFRASSRGFGPRTVPPGETVRVEFVLPLEEPSGTVREAVAADRLVLSGVVSARIASERFDISLDSAVGADGGESP